MAIEDRHPEVAKWTETKQKIANDRQVLMLFANAGQEYHPWYLLIEWQVYI